jgi:hypothetical protein
MSKDAAQKPGFTARTLGWGAKKFRHPEVSGVSRQVVSSGARAAIAAIRPTRADFQDLRAGVSGRYEDGGAARFRDLVASSGLEEADLPEISLRHRRQALVNLAVSVFVLAVSIAMIISSSQTVGILGGAGFSIFSLVFAALAIRSDFSAWRIDVRRMDGFKAYIDHRFG